MKQRLLNILSTAVLLPALLLAGCDKYLDVKNSSSTIIPNRVSELEAIMDNPAVVALNSIPAQQERISDYSILTPDAFAALSDEERNEYLFNVQPEDLTVSSTWTSAYKKIFSCNVVLDLLPTVKDGLTQRGLQLKGHALYYRGFTHFMLLEHFSMPYNKETADKDPGIPIKKNPAEGDKTVRSTVAGSYKSILEDLDEAVRLLPAREPLLTRPDKLAAHAVLARIYLVRGEYDKARDHASEVLSVTSYVDDYNTRDLGLPLPFNYNMEEIIIPHSGVGPMFSDPRKSLVTPAFYQSYDEDDLRKTGLFTVNAPDNIVFKGSYTGWVSAAMFVGTTVPEMLLIRAECWARGGDADKAMKDLNDLLQHRYKKEHFQLRTASGADDALMQVITERKKELPFRGLRAMDLRRLGNDPRFAVTLERTITVNGQTFTATLRPGSNRYALPIPKTVIDLTGIEQNNLK
ncbi:RagB/SusD family nutrient uptake outer membrane protein [Chitinophaga defluvii]|uniref:RagB/SusD family nutrient uptake outer membrane protein n=1 Tax=Chitinophaga defluvii TaxID=3163343 RepID=A0ABV2SZX0_9BACT